MFQRSIQDGRDRCNAAPSSTWPWCSVSWSAALLTRGFSVWTHRVGWPVPSSTWTRARILLNQHWSANVCEVTAVGSPAARLVQATHKVWVEAAVDPAGDARTASVHAQRARVQAAMALTQHFGHPRPSMECGKWAPDSTSTRGYHCCSCIRTSEWVGGTPPSPAAGSQPAVPSSQAGRVIDTGLLRTLEAASTRPALTF